MLYSVNVNIFSYLTVLGFIIFSHWYSLELSKLIQIVMLLTCIWEASGSNLSRDTGCLRFFVLFHSPQGSCQDIALDRLFDEHC
jgi:hypothetical protein